MAWEISPRPGAVYTMGTCHKGLLGNLGAKDGAFGKPLGCHEPDSRAQFLRLKTFCKVYLRHIIVMLHHYSCDLLFLGWILYLYTVVANMANVFFWGVESVSSWWQVAASGSETGQAVFGIWQPDDLSTASGQNSGTLQTNAPIPAKYRNTTESLILISGCSVTLLKRHLVERHLVVISAHKTSTYACTVVRAQ